jgi:transposase
VVRQLRFAPTRAGLTELAAWLANVAPADAQVGLEATGIYWLTLHAWLQQWGAVAIHVLNPLQTRAFRNANLRGVKSDRADAVGIARLRRWEGTRRRAHTRADERQQAAREVSRPRTEMIELRARQLTKWHTVLDPLFPEFAAAFSDLGSASALAVLARWPGPAALAAARPSELTRVLHAASRGHLGAAKARELRERAATSVGVADPYGATGIAVQTLVAHLEHLRAQIASLGERLDALQTDEAATRQLLATVPGFGRETVRTWLAEPPPVRTYADQARAESRALPPGKKPKQGADELVAAVGLDAQVRQSGRRRGQVRMSKRGNRYVRRAVMLAAQTASRTDPQCAATYTAQRAKGKHHRVAVSHVAHQLLHIAYSVLLHARPYTIPPRFTAAADAPPLVEVEACSPLACLRAASARGCQRTWSAAAALPSSRIPVKCDATFGGRAQWQPAVDHGPFRSPPRRGGGLDRLEPRVREQRVDHRPGTPDVRPREVDLGRDTPRPVGGPPEVGRPVREWVERIARACRRDRTGEHVVGAVRQVQRGL